LDDLTSRTIQGFFTSCLAARLDASLAGIAEMDLLVLTAIAA
jgi:hypothetical protein